MSICLKEKKNITTSTDHSCLHFVLSFSVCGNLDLSQVNSADFRNRRAKLPAKCKHVQTNYLYMYSKRSQKFTVRTWSLIFSEIHSSSGAWQHWVPLANLRRSAGNRSACGFVEHCYVTVGGIKSKEVTMKLPHFRTDFWKGQYERKCSPVCLMRYN